MVDPQFQNSSIPIRLIQQYAYDEIADGVAVDLIDCNKHLVPFFERFGYFSYIGWRFHKEYGTVRPMFFPVDTIAYQTIIGSPLLPPAVHTSPTAPTADTADTT
jgi:hypothetical protein